ncbi:hypothetical protein [Bernardetia sp.]|uniref:hypothetical protein n=1 Tax=Bernardetia sp. TaxID=1937974 RepID=UPI0025C27542|nr:hypothetical protein [Bernardetia sp.]
MYKNLYVERNRIIYQSLEDIQNQERGNIVLFCFPTFYKDFGISFYKYYGSYHWVKNTIVETKDEELTESNIKLSLLFRKETGILSETTFKEIENKIKNTPFPQTQIFGEGGRDGTTYKLTLNSAVSISLSWWDASLEKDSDWQPINNTISEITKQVKNFEAEEKKEFLYIYEEDIYKDNLTGDSRVMTHIEFKSI